MKFPFRRNKDVSDVPTEFKEYYQTERRERTGMAWLLALGTLLITITLATLLFFGGRWLYRTVTNNNQNTEQTQGNQGQVQNNPSESTPEQVSPDTGTSSTSTSTPNSPATPTEGTAGSTTPTTPSTSTQVAGSSTNPLPNTGGGDVVALFVATTVLASVAHFSVTTRRITE